MEIEPSSKAYTSNQHTALPEADHSSSKGTTISWVSASGSLGRSMERQQEAGRA